MSAVLVIGPSWVGDMVMAQSLFKLLRQQQPERAIDVLAPAWSQPILARMPEVRRALDMPLGHGQVSLGERRRIGRSLQGEYEQAILLPNTLKSALIPFWAKIPLRTGWRGEMRYGLLNDLRKLDKARYPLMVQRFAALAFPRDHEVLPLDAIPRPALVIEPSQQQQALRRLGLDTGRPVLALCPGAEFGAAKQWPASHYAAVAARKIQEGFQVWIFGSANDQAVAGEIRALLVEQGQEVSGYCHVLAGKTSLAEAVDLLALARGAVTNDSGLMHIAAALSVPLVAVYGSTSPEFTPPLGDAVAVVRSDLECSPCFQRTCPLGHSNCLKQLLPVQVAGALEQVMAVKTVQSSASGGS